MADLNEKRNEFLSGFPVANSEICIFFDLSFRFPASVDCIWPRSGSLNVEIDPR